MIRHQQLTISPKYPKTTRLLVVGKLHWRQVICSSVIVVFEFFMFRNRLANAVRSMLYFIYITGQILTATSENPKIAIT